MSKYDEILSKMINDDTIEIIIKMLRDYLQQHES